MISVLVADDDDGVRRALVELIGDDPLFTVVAIATCAAQAVEFAASMRPDLAVVDVRMPGGGVAAASGIGTSSPATKVVACSTFDDDDSRAAMYGAGAIAYVVKGSALTGLLPTLRTVAAVDQRGSDEH